MSFTEAYRNKLKSMSYTNVEKNFSAVYCAKCGGYMSGTWAGINPPDPCRCNEVEEQQPINFIPPPIPKSTIYVEKKIAEPTIVQAPKVEQIPVVANKVEMGWQCPLCMRIYSPKTMMCPTCIPENQPQ